jgi:hypothetical protein
MLGIERIDMTPIVVVPSEWVLAYFFGFLLFYLIEQKAEDFRVSFVISMVYWVSLTIGLRLYYGG